MYRNKQQQPKKGGRENSPWSPVRVKEMDGLDVCDEVDGEEGEGEGGKELRRG